MKFFYIIIILIFGFRCKGSDNDSNLNSLDQLAGSKDVHMCKGNFKVKDDYLNNKIDNITTKEEKLALIDSLSAVPEVIQEAFFEDGYGRIKLVSDITSACIDSSLKDQFNNLGKDNPLRACYQLSTNGIVIYISKNPAHIRSSLLRVFGYYLSEVFVYINDGFDDFLFLDKSSNPTIDDMKKQLTIAFLEDIEASKEFKLSNFIDNLPEALLYPKKANRLSVWNSLKGDDLLKAKIFSNWVFAESFDSSFCNNETLLSLTSKGVFKKTGKLLGITPKNEPQGLSLRRFQSMEQYQYYANLMAQRRAKKQALRYQNRQRIRENMSGQSGGYAYPSYPMPSQRPVNMPQVNGQCYNGNCNANTYTRAAMMRQQQRYRQASGFGNFINVITPNGYKVQYRDNKGTPTNYFSDYNPKTRTFSEPYLSAPSRQSELQYQDGPPQYQQDSNNNYFSKIWDTLKSGASSAGKLIGGFVSKAYNNYRNNKSSFQNQQATNPNVLSNYNTPQHMFRTPNESNQPDQSKYITLSIIKSGNYRGGAVMDHRGKAVCRGFSRKCGSYYLRGQPIKLSAPYQIKAPLKQQNGFTKTVDWKFAAWICYHAGVNGAQGANICRESPNNKLECNIVETNTDIICTVNYIIMQ